MFCRMSRLDLFSNLNGFMVDTLARVVTKFCENKVLGGVLLSFFLESLSFILLFV